MDFERSFLATSSHSDSADRIKRAGEDSRSYLRIIRSAGTPGIGCLTGRGTFR